MIKNNIEQRIPEKKDGGYKRFYVESEKSRQIDEYKLSKGLVQIYTGDGKGKSCTAVGLAIRASGANLKTGFFQFFKKPFSCEIKVLRSIPNIHFYSFASYYYEAEYITQDEIKKLQNDFRHIWEKTVSIVSKNNYDVIIFDEILIAVRDHLISEQQIVDFVKGKQKNTELILTGRYLTKKITGVADVITELKNVKHPFPEIKARKGIDF